MSAVKVYVTTQGCRELAGLNIAVGGIEHAQKIPLSGVKISLHCILVIVGGAEHAQTFNFWTAPVMMTSNPPSKRG